jgi:hypothetical protein
VGDPQRGHAPTGRPAEFSETRGRLPSGSHPTW